MDAFDRDRYVTAYRALAEILERERPADREERHFSFILGDLTRRVFVGTTYDPPDEVLEQVADALRNGSPDDLRRLAGRMRDHARHLQELDLA